MLTLLDAILWVQQHDPNARSINASPKELEQAFRLIFDREPTAQDYKKSLWEQLRHGWRSVEEQHCTERIQVPTPSGNKRPFGVYGQ
jgi:hypothetical protein